MNNDVEMEPIEVEAGTDMSYDPFDEVVDIEPVEESEGENEEESLEESEETEDIVDESEESEESESDDEDTEDKEEESTEDGDKDEVGVDDINKKLEDGSLEVKINDETVTLKDLKNDYIGQKEIARRFTEYDVKSKQLEADTTEINGYINEFAGKLKSGDSVGAMAYFGEFAGIAPYMIKEQLIAALAPEIMRREQMTSMEVQNEYLSSQNQYLQEQRESELNAQQYSQAKQEADTFVNELRETNGIDEQTWNEASSHLEKTLGEGEKLTPELVADTIKYSRMYDQAESVINLSTENLENREQWIEELVSVKEKYPDFTDGDLKEILDDALRTVKKSSKEQNLAKKLDSKSKTTSKKQIKQTNPIDEDIDPELEDWI